MHSTQLFLTDYFLRYYSSLLFAQGEEVVKQVGVTRFLADISLACPTFPAMNWIVMSCVSRMKINVPNELKNMPYFWNVHKWKRTPPFQIFIHTLSVISWLKYFSDSLEKKTSNCFNKCKHNVLLWFPQWVSWTFLQNFRL